MKPEESEGCSNLTDNTLAISAFVLEALQRASQIAAVPFLQMAASIALSIVQQTQVCFTKSSPFFPVHSELYVGDQRYQG